MRTEPSGSTSHARVAASCTSSRLRRDRGWCDPLAPYGVRVHTTHAFFRRKAPSATPTRHTPHAAHPHRPPDCCCCHPTRLLSTGWSGAGEGPAHNPLVNSHPPHPVLAVYTQDTLCTATARARGDQGAHTRDNPTLTQHTHTHTHTQHTHTARSPPPFHSKRLTGVRTARCRHPEPQCQCPLSLGAGAGRSAQAVGSRRRAGQRDTCGAATARRRRRRRGGRRGGGQRGAERAAAAARQAGGAARPAGGETSRDSPRFRRDPPRCAVAPACRSGCRSTSCLG